MQRRIRYEPEREWQIFNDSTWVFYHHRSHVVDFNFYFFFIQKKEHRMGRRIILNRNQAIGTFHSTRMHEDSLMTEVTGKKWRIILGENKWIAKSFLYAVSMCIWLECERESYIASFSTYNSSFLFQENSIRFLLWNRIRIRYPIEWMASAQTFFFERKVLIDFSFSYLTHLIQKELESFFIAS